MIKEFGWATFVACSLMCSQAQAGELRGWERYTGYAGLRGLHLKPIVVVFDRRGIMVNQRRIAAEGALRLLSKSQSLSPLPDILVRADHVRSKIAHRFMKRVDDAGLCESRKCLYSISR